VEEKKMAGSEYISWSPIRRLMKL